MPLARAYSSSLLTANSRWPSRPTARQDDHGDDGEDARGRRCRRGDRAEQVGRQVGRPAARGEADQHDAAGDPAVEHHRERDVAAGAAAGPDELDQHRAERRRRPARCTTGRGRR